METYVMAAATVLAYAAIIARLERDFLAPRRRSAKNPPCSRCRHCISSWCETCSLVRNMASGDPEYCVLARNDRRCRFEAKERAEDFHEWLSEMEGAEE